MSDARARPSARVAAARPDEHAALALVYGLAFDDPFPKPAFDGLAATPGAFVLAGRLAEGGTREAAPAGFVIARAVAGEGEILSVGVDPARRRAGLGRALIDAALDRLRARGAEEAFLEVALDNPAAQGLYRLCGFDAIGRRPGYYRRERGQVMDALLFRRDLAC